jgi:hypothetical protein
MDLLNAKSEGKEEVKDGDKGERPDGEDKADGNKDTSSDKTVGSGHASMAGSESVREASSGNAKSESRDPDQQSPKPKPDEGISAEFRRNFETLSQRERELRQQKQQLSEGKGAIKELAELKRKLKDDPYSVIEASGGSYEEYSKRVLNDGKPAESEQIRKLQEQVQKLEKANAEAAERNDAEQRRREADAQVKKQLDVFDGIVASDSKYKSLGTYANVYEAVTGAKLDIHEAVKATAIEYYNSTGNVLSLQDIANCLTDEANTRLKSMKENKAMNELLGAAKSVIETNEANTGSEDKTSPEKEEEAPQSAVEGGARTTRPKNLDSLDGYAKIDAITHMFEQKGK